MRRLGSTQKKNASAYGIKYGVAADAWSEKLVRAVKNGAGGLFALRHNKSGALESGDCRVEIRSSATLTLAT